MDLELQGPAQNPSLTQQFTSVTTETSGGNDIQWTKTAGGSTLRWISEPLSSTTTISGTITFNIYAKEAAAADNSTIRVSVILYHGGAETTTISNCGFATELTTSMVVKNWSTASGGWTACSVTSTTIAVGDRIVVKAFINGCTTTCTVAGGGMGTGSVTVDYDGPTDGSNGSSWVQLNETETFSVEASAHAIWVQVNYGNAAGSGWSVTDDGGNTYDLVTNCIQTANGQGMMFFIAFNVVAARKITVTHSGGTVVFFSADAAELSNIAAGSAVDTSSCFPDSGSAATAITAGTSNMVPVFNNDLFLHGYFENLAATTTAYALVDQSASNINWKFLTTKLSAAEAVQWGVQTTATSFIPQFTRANTGNIWYSGAIALKSSGGTPDIVRWVATPNMDNTGQGSAAGGSISFFLPAAALTATTGMYIRGIQAETYTPTTVSPQVLQFTNAGNLVIDAFSSGEPDIISVTGSNCNITGDGTWKRSAAALINSGDSANIFCYLENAPTGLHTLTMTMAGTASSDDVHHILDVVGANSAQGTINDVTGIGFMSGTNITPLNTANGQITSGSLTITPANANSLIVTVVGINFNTVNVMNTSGCLEQNGFLSLNNAANTPFYENNGFGTCLNHAVSSTAMDWSIQSGLGANTGQWASRSAEFIAPVSTSTPPGHFVVIQ